MRSLLLCLSLVTFCAGYLPAQSPKPIRLVLDTSEADQALTILAKQRAHVPVIAADWQKLFTTVPYIALRAREAAIGRPFTDEQFKSFLSSPAALDKEAEWTVTLQQMKTADMTALAQGVLTWLPEGASIHASVFPEIKPIHNSFVWTSPEVGPAIFLYLEAQSKDKFENTVAHECHHIGLASVEKHGSEDSTTSPTVRAVVHWMSGFGEGEGCLPPQDRQKGILIGKTMRRPVLAGMAT